MPSLSSDSGDLRALRVEIGDLLELGHRLVEITLAIVRLADPVLRVRGQVVLGKLVDEIGELQYRLAMLVGAEAGHRGRVELLGGDVASGRRRRRLRRRHGAGGGTAEGRHLLIRLVERGAGVARTAASCSWMAALSCSRSVAAVLVSPTRNAACASSAFSSPRQLAHVLADLLLPLLRSSSTCLTSAAISASRRAFSRAAAARRPRAGRGPGGAPCTRLAHEGRSPWP